MLDKNLLDDRFRSDGRFQIGGGFGGLDLFIIDDPQVFDSIAEPHPLWSYYGVAIDWNYTNRKLAQWFEEQLNELRPADRPEPKKPGRHGISSDAGPMDMLNQLAAFRLDRAGLGVEQARERVQIFGSAMRYKPGSAGWGKAIRAAKNRIDRMLKEPFFSHIGFALRKK
ncbi:MAG TPA: hypothetical protein VNY07_03200 [Chthoniobacterales bacterium]|nr:hypothetical protein [Chthoniobacterales bacterium]